jgi:hypothetical protein
MIPCHPCLGKWLVWRCPVKSHDRLHREIAALMVLPYRHPNPENVILQDLTPNTLSMANCQDRRYGAHYRKSTVAEKVLILWTSPSSLVTLTDDQTLKPTQSIDAGLPWYKVTILMRVLSDRINHHTPVLIARTSFSSSFEC